MATKEESTPTKPSKHPTSMQETPPAPSYPDWSTSMQAYYGAGAAPFFASTVASPTPHPYMWGSQHPLIPPYGTPIPYPAIYPPGGVYAHPSMAMTPGAVLANMELDEKTPDGKEQVPAKKSKGTSGLKAGESGKTASGSGNDGGTLSAESGSEGSSEASDENTNQKESAATKKGSFDLMLVDGANAPNRPVDANLSVSVQGKPVASVPATNLNIGMELWTPPAGVGAVKTRQNPTGEATPPTMVGREASGTDHQWIQDERELKRQKRKQSNRESARRSRLRKQAAEAGFRRLGIEKLSIADMQCLKWEAVDAKIRRSTPPWICTMPCLICCTTMDDACFIETMKDLAIQLFNFAKDISISHQPSVSGEAVLNLGSVRCLVGFVAVEASKSVILIILIKLKSI